MPFKKLEDKQDYQRQWLEKRKRKFFKDKKCEKCGSKTNLEMHHRDKDDKVSHKIWSWAPDKFKEEAAKCKIWCRKCHQEHHGEERTEEAKD
jgi:hypothetical protein